MTEAYANRIQELVLQIAEDRARFISERVAALPAGWVLCVHDGVMGADLDVHTFRFQFSAHGIAAPEECRWVGRREVYARK